MYWPMFCDPSALKFFGISDAWVYTGAALFYVDHGIHHGEFPLWNPLVFCGQPIAGNPQYLLFYPPNLVRSLLTFEPTPWKTQVGLAVLAVAHVVFAALGAFALGRRRGLTRSAAGFAGVVFVFSAAMTQRYFMHHHMVFVVAWLPWCLLALDWAMASITWRSAAGRFGVLGIVFAMCLLAGSPGITYFVAIALVLYWFLARMESIIRDRRAGRALHDVCGGAFAVSIALGLSAVFLLPAIEFASHTQRTGGDAPRIETAPGYENMNAIEALLFYPGGNSHEGVKGIGVAALLLCVPALFSRRRGDAIVFLLIGMLLVSMGRTDSWLTHQVVGALAPFPISSPGRMTLVAALPLALLAGLGLDRLREPFARRATRLAATGAVVASGAFAAVTLYSLTIGPGDERGFDAAHSLVFAGITTAGIAAALWLPARRWLTVSVAALVLAEGLYWQTTRIATVARRDELFYHGTRASANIQPDFWAANTRDSRFSPNSNLYSLEGQINGYDPLQLRGFGELIAPEGDTSFYRGVVEVARWSDRPYLLMKRAFWLQREVVTGSMPPRGTPFPVTTTAFLDTGSAEHVPIIQLESVARTPHSANVECVKLADGPINLSSSGDLNGASTRLSVVKDDSSRHRTLRLFVSSDVRAELEVRLPEKVADRAAGLCALLNVDPERAPQEFNVPLPDGLISTIEIASLFPGGAGTVTIATVELVLDRDDESGHIGAITRTGNTVFVELLDVPGFRVLSYIDFHYPGWRAYADGVEAPLLRTFSYFKGVEVPPGSHTVRFEYRPASVRAGMGVTAAAIVATALLLIWAFRERRSGFAVHSTNDHGPGTP